MSKYNNMVVIVSQYGEKYIGTLAPQFTRGHLQECVEESRPVELLDARLLIAKSQAVGTTDGNIVGLKNFICITDIDMAIFPIPKFYILPAAWYFVEDLPEIHKNLDQLFKEAEDNEKVNKAQSAGLHIPGRS